MQLIISGLHLFVLHYFAFENNKLHKKSRIKSRKPTDICNIKIKTLISRTKINKDEKN